MVKKGATFQLNLAGGAYVLQNMARPLMEQSAKAIASRAESMAASISSNPPKFSYSVTVTANKRGARAIGTAYFETTDPSNEEHQAYIGRMALNKSRDAGRV